MPTYEYECLECNFSFEAFQKMSDSLLTECPHCKGKVKRLIGSGTGLIFKGSGFYATDYKKKEASGNSEGKPKAQTTPCSQCPNASCDQKGKQQ